jgi:hypothetical protein
VCDALAERASVGLGLGVDVEAAGDNKRPELRSPLAHELIGHPRIALVPLADPVVRGLIHQDELLEEAFFAQAPEQGKMAGPHAPVRRRERQHERVAAEEPLNCMAQVRLPLERQRTEAERVEQRVEDERRLSDAVPLAQKEEPRPA